MNSINIIDIISDNSLNPFLDYIAEIKGILDMKPVSVFFYSS